MLYWIQNWDKGYIGAYMLTVYVSWSMSLIGGGFAMNGSEDSLVRVELDRGGRYSGIVLRSN